MHVYISACKMSDLCRKATEVVEKLIAAGSLDQSASYEKL